MYGRVGGGGYERYRSDAIFVVRPDGYVGVVAPFEQLADVSAYFAGFILA